MPSPENIFVNYSSPWDQYDPHNRRKVAAHIGRNYRNRSRPGQRAQGGFSNTIYRGPKTPLTIVSKVTENVEQPQRAEGIKPLEWNDTNRSTERSTSSETLGSTSFKVVKWNTGQRLAPVVSRDGHGFGIDPFDTLPIAQRKHVPQTIAYCE